MPKIINAVPPNKFAYLAINSILFIAFPIINAPLENREVINPIITE